MSKTTILYKDIAPGSEEDASISTSSAEPFSNPSDLPSGVSPGSTITCEHNHWILNGTYQFVENEPVAFWSTEMSGEDGVFDNPPVITITFDNQYSSAGITLVFDSASGDYCSLVNIKWYQNESLKAEKDFTPTASIYFCQQTAESYNKIVITLKSTNLPGRRAKLEHIIFGIYRYFDMSELRSASIVNETNLISSELPISTLKWVLDSRENVDFMFQLKQPVEARNDDSLIGVFYINSSARSSSSVYNIDCYDAIGVLDETTFPGGAYLSGISAKTLLEEIVGDDFTVAYDEDVEDTIIKGILRPGSKRSAMQQVLFAWGVCLSTDGRDTIRVFILKDTPKEIGKNKTYTGVNVTTSSIVTRVSITAHTYSQSEDGSVEINGTKYDDTKTVYSVSNPNVTATDKQNVIEVTDATMVSTDIGQSVAQRVYDYYLKRNTNTARIVWDGEHLGDLLTMPNAWNGTNTGHVCRMEIRLSNTVAATCESVGI